MFPISIRKSIMIFIKLQIFKTHVKSTKTILNLNKTKVRGVTKTDFFSRMYSITKSKKNVICKMCASFELEYQNNLKYEIRIAKFYSQHNSNNLIIYVKHGSIGIYLLLEMIFLALKIQVSRKI